LSELIKRNFHTIKYATDKIKLPVAIILCVKFFICTYVQLLLAVFYLSVAWLLLD
jgi:hypothetical protein